MKGKLLLIGALALTGCGTSLDEVRKAEQFCEGHGGWVWVSSVNVMRCRDGSVAKSHDYKLRSTETPEEVQSE